MVMVSDKYLLNDLLLLWGAKESDASILVNFLKHNKNFMILPSFSMLLSPFFAKFSRNPHPIVID
jgi:hypothetical protein